MYSLSENIWKGKPSSPFKPSRSLQSKGHNMKQRKNPQNASKFSAEAFISDFFILLAYTLMVKFQSAVYSNIYLTLF